MKKTSKELYPGNLRPKIKNVDKLHQALPVLYLKKCLRALKAAERENKTLKADLNKLVIESISHGEHLHGEMFIPEYLGFTETLHEDHDEGKNMRIYSREGYNITRIENHDWLILTPDESKIVFTITTMYDAIAIFKCMKKLGISIEKFLEVELIK